MALSLECHCGHAFAIPDGATAKQVPCPVCGRSVEVPPLLAPLHLPPWQHGRPTYSAPRDYYSDGPPPTNGKATASLILGIVSLVTGLLFGVPAIIFGALAWKEIGRSRGRQLGEGMATAGLTMGLISCVLTAAVLILLFSDLLSVREPAERSHSQNNLKQMALATINYTDVNNGHILDEAAIHSQDGRQLLSWRVAILPYMDQDPLYHQFHLDEPWDSEHNQRLISQMPQTYVHLSYPKDSAQGLTHYRAIIGPDTAFARGSRYPGSITDGTSQTIMIVEAEDAVPWTKPDELVYDPKGPLPRFSKHFKSGFQVALWDASVRNVSHRISEETLRAAITARGFDILGSDW